MIVPKRVADRIVSNAVRDPAGCLISRYSAGSHGYAQIGWREPGQRIVTTAHRALWVATHGDPGPLTVDHQCHNKRCVELTHLRLLTNALNSSDNGQVRTNPETARRCYLGHPMVLSLGTGKTYCRECKARRKRERRRQ